MQANAQVSILHDWQAAIESASPMEVRGSAEECLIAKQAPQPPVTSKVR